jgi:hypothetical protein
MKTTLTFVLIFFLATVHAQIPVSGLVGWWPFSGDANDYSGYASHGQVNGATLTTDRFGHPNSAYFFPGNVANKIIIPDAPQFQFNDSFTVSLWAKFHQSWLFHVEDLISKYTYPMNDGWSIGVNQDDAAYGAGNYALSGVVGSPGGPLGANYIQPFNFINTWRHYVMTSDGIYCRIFIDGILRDSVSMSGAVINNNLNIEIGGSAHPVSGAYDRDIDDVRIYNRSLSQQEISSLFNENICFQTITVTDTLIINANLTGLNPVSWNNTIKMYPNPASNKLYIDNGNNYNDFLNYTIRIDNALAQTVYSTTISQQFYLIDLNTWTGNGTYFVYLINSFGQMVEVRKIILQ